MLKRYLKGLIVIFFVGIFCLKWKDIKYCGRTKKEIEPKDHGPREYYFFLNFFYYDEQKLRIVGKHWLIYEGEVGKNSSSSSKKPAFCVRRNMSIMKAKASVLAYVYGGPSRKGFKYTIEGSYTRRSCKILDESGRACSEIKRKKPLKGGASFGLEVFDLIVKPGFDSRFAMAIVLLLDQMFS